MGTPNSKGAAFAKDAEEAGWATQIWWHGDVETVVCLKTADLFLTMRWDAGRHDYAASGLVIRGKAKKIRNAAEARRMLTGDIQPPSERKPTRNRSKVRAEPVGGSSTAATDVLEDVEEESWADRIARMKATLPFKVSSPEKDILKAVIGKKITWINSRTKHEESAHVLSNPNQKQLKIEFTRDTRRRVLTFAAAGEGFRSVHIDSIIQVN